jgi:hypothetical protein
VTFAFTPAPAALTNADQLQIGSILSILQLLGQLGLGRTNPGSPGSPGVDNTTALRSIDTRLKDISDRLEKLEVLPKAVAGIQDRITNTKDGIEARLLHIAEQVDKIQPQTDKIK